MVLLWSALAFSEPAWRVPVQGSIDEGSVPPNGTRTLTVELFADSGGTTPVFAQTFSTDLVDGAFSVVLAAEPEDGVPHLGVHPELFVRTRLAGGAPSELVAVGEAARATWSRDTDRLDGLESADLHAAAWRPAWSDLQGAPTALATSGEVRGASLLRGTAFSASATGVAASSFLGAGGFSATGAGDTVASGWTAGAFVSPGFSVSGGGAVAAASALAGPVVGAAVRGASYALPGGAFAVDGAGAITAASVTTAGAGSGGALTATSVTTATARVTDQGACGASGTLGYAGGTLYVCDGSAWRALLDSAGTSATQRVLDFQYAQTAAAQSLPTVIPWDNSVPQATEGNALLQVTITPKAANNLLVFEGVVNWTEPSNTSDYFTAAVFRAGQADAIATFSDGASNGNGRCTGNGTYDQICTMPVYFVATAPSAAAQTYTLRVGLNGGPVSINQGHNGQRLGGTLTSYFSVTELRP